MAPTRSARCALESDGATRAPPRVLKRRPSWRRRTSVLCQVTAFLSFGESRVAAFAPPFALQAREVRPRGDSARSATRVSRGVWRAQGSLSLASRQRNGVELTAALRAAAAAFFARAAARPVVRRARARSVPVRPLRRAAVPRRAHVGGARRRRVARGGGARARPPHARRGTCRRRIVSRRVYKCSSSERIDVDVGFAWHRGYSTGVRTRGVCMSETCTGGRYVPLVVQN